MEILINELSLDGQYLSIEDFINNGIRQLLPLLKEFKDEDTFFKKQDFYTRIVTSNITIHDILISNKSRSSDEIRRFKSHLLKFFKEPYWENSQVHGTSVAYNFKNAVVTGSSLAESCERDKVVLSFNHIAYTTKKLIVSKDNTEFVIDNLIEKDDFVKLLDQRGLLTSFSLKNRNFFRRTALIQQGQTVFTEIATSHYWYLDNLHKNHYEVFNSNKIHIGTADLNGKLDYTQAVNGRSL